MLTKIEDVGGHSWVELESVMSVAGDDTKCLIRSPAFPGGLTVDMSGADMVAMVNEAKIKAKVYGYVGESMAADDVPEQASMVPYHEGQQHALRAAQLQINAALAGTRPEDALDHIRMWLKQRIGDHPHKLFSDRLAFTPKQLQDAKRDVIKSLASWMGHFIQHKCPTPKDSSDFIMDLIPRILEGRSGFQATMDAVNSYCKESGLPEIMPHTNPAEQDQPEVK